MHFHHGHFHTEHTDPSPASNRCHCILGIVPEAVVGVMVAVAVAAVAVAAVVTAAAVTAEANTPEAKDVADTVEGAATGVATAVVGWAAAATARHIAGV